MFLKKSSSSDKRRGKLKKRTTIQHFINWKVRFVTTNGMHFVGKLLAADSHLNVVLGDCEQVRTLPIHKGFI